MMAFASGIVGISSGAIANVLMEQQALSARAPSVVAGFVTFLCLLTIIFGWNENVGTLYGGLSKPLLNGIQALRGESPNFMVIFSSMEYQNRSLVLFVKDKPHKFIVIVLLDDVVHFCSNGRPLVSVVTTRFYIIIF